MDFSVDATDGRLLEILWCALCLCCTCKHFQLTRENTFQIPTDHLLVLFRMFTAGCQKIFLNLNNVHY